MRGGPWRFACQAQVEDGDVDDATRVLTSTGEGLFMDAERLAMTRSVDVDCEGAGCAALAEALTLSFPCQHTSALDATWSAEL